MIPRRLHAIWLGGDLPHFAQRFLAGWQELHPGWEFRLWTSPDELEMRHAGYVERAERYVPREDRASASQFISDLMRYEILERFGGVYVDCDMECKRPIDELLGAECFAAWEVQDMWVGNAILGAEPGALFVQRLLEMVPNSIERHRRKRPNQSTGPRFVTEQYRGHEDELTVLPQAWMYPVPWSSFERSTEEHPGAWTVHHWSNQRRRAGLPL